MEKSQWVKKVLSLHPADRIKKFGQTRFSTVIQKTPQYYLKKQQSLQTPDWLIKTCNTNNIYTIQQLRQYNRNKPFNQKISMNAINYWFGSWRSFKRRLQIKIAKQTRYKQSQIIDLCVRFGVKKRSDFQLAHQKQPTIFPAYDWVQRHFGRWKNFKRVLQACSVQQILQKYINLKMKLGRYPSKIQCRKNDIQIQTLLTVWQPTQLRDTVQLLEEIYKNAKK